jgi:predicted MFS family arabinose efflux permease
MPFSLSLRRRSAIFIVAACGYLLSQFYRSFLTVIADDLMRDLAMGPQAFGALGSAWFFAFSLSQFGVGMALDRYGPRRTISGMMLFAVAGAFLFASATTHGLAVVAMALIGVGCAPLLMGTLYFFARTEPPARFAALGSVFLACGLIGGLIAATPLAVLVDAMGWRAAIRLVALVTTGVALLNAIIFRDPPQEVSPPGGSLFGDILDLLRIPSFWPILVMSFAISGPVFTERSLWVGPFFAQVYGLDLIAKGNAVLALAIAMTVSAILAGPLAGRLDNTKTVVLGGNLLCGATFLALGLWPQAPLPAAVFMMMMVGLSGVTYAVLIAHGRLFMPGHVIGRGITFINFVSIGGTGVTQLGSGIAVERMGAAGLSAAETYANLHLAFGALLIVSALIYALARAKPG